MCLCSIFATSLVNVFSYLENLKNKKGEALGLPGEPKPQLSLSFTPAESFQTSLLLELCWLFLEPPFSL